MPPVNRPVVKTAMRQALMGRSDLADATGISPKTLSNALGAFHQPLDDTKIQAICDVLELKYEDVVDVEQRPNPNASAEPTAADEPTAVPAKAVQVAAPAAEMRRSA